MIGKNVKNWDTTVAIVYYLTKFYTFSTKTNKLACRHFLAKVHWPNIKAHVQIDRSTITQRQYV